MLFQAFFHKLLNVFQAFFALKQKHCSNNTVMLLLIENDLYLVENVHDKRD